MSGGVACKCAERHEPIHYAPGLTYSHKGMEHPCVSRLWRVWQRNGNASCFNGYHWQYSDYSCITCVRCGAIWRTKAAYVVDLPDLNDAEKNIARGYAGHVAAMAERGRVPHGQHPLDGDKYETQAVA
jgi:hypothetical protein